MLLLVMLCLAHKIPDRPPDRVSDMNRSISRYNKFYPEYNSLDSE